MNWSVKMKIVFCIFLLFNFCQCDENSVVSENTSLGKLGANNGGKLDVVNLEDKDQNQDYIIRPCSFQDLNCIRGFFVQNLQCLITEGPVPNPYVLQLLPNLHVPHANLTFELVNPVLKGLDKMRIEEFYINKATDTLVLEVVFEKIMVICPEAKLKYYRKGKEPLQVSDYSIIEYNDLSFTLTITNIKNPQLSKADVYTYINDIAPKYTLGPATYSSKDPGFILAITELETKLDRSLKEVFVTQGPVFFFAFFNSNICSFGNY